MPRLPQSATAPLTFPAGGSRPLDVGFLGGRLTSPHGHPARVPERLWVRGSGRRRPTCAPTPCSSRSAVACPCARRTWPASRPSPGWRTSSVPASAIGSPRRWAQCPCRSVNATAPRSACWRKPDSWPSERRGVVEAEVLPRGTSTRFVVTTRDEDPTAVYDWYVDRGETEKGIKDLKRGCFADGTPLDAHDGAIIAVRCAHPRRPLRGHRRRRGGLERVGTKIVASTDARSMASRTALGH